MYMESQTFFLKKAFLPLFHNPPNRVMAPSERSELGAYQTFTGSGVLHLKAESPNLMQLLSQINPLWRCPREKVGGAKRSSRTGQCRGHKEKKYFLIFHNPPNRVIYMYILPIESLQGLVLTQSPNLMQPLRGQDPHQMI